MNSCLISYFVSDVIIFRRGVSTTCIIKTRPRVQETNTEHVRTMCTDRFPALPAMYSSMECVKKGLSLSPPAKKSAVCLLLLHFNGWFARFYLASTILQGAQKQLVSFKKELFFLEHLVFPPPSFLCVCEVEFLGEEGKELRILCLYLIRYTYFVLLYWGLFTWCLHHFVRSQRLV